MEFWENTGWPMINEHLTFQLGRLSHKNGYARGGLDYLPRLENAESAWEYLVERYNVNRTLVEQIKETTGVSFKDAYRTGSKVHQNYFLKFDVYRLKNETVARICRALAIDYCCLNLELPPYCKNTGAMCTIRRVHSNGPKYITAIIPAVPGYMTLSLSEC